jgi:hypothetical protein
VDDQTVDIDETTGEVLDAMTREGRAFAGAAAAARPSQMMPTQQPPQRW